MTSMPASRSARATTLAPRSWPSRPGLAMTTRMGAEPVSWVAAAAWVSLMLTPLWGRWSTRVLDTFGLLKSNRAGRRGPCDLGHWGRGGGSTTSYAGGRALAAGVLRARAWMHDDERCEPQPHDESDARDRGARADEVLRAQDGGRRADLPGALRAGDRVPGAERRREVDDH